MVTTTVYTCIGLPAQIRQNHRERSVRGLSFLMTLLLACTFLAWLVYGLVKSPVDWFIVISNLPGAFCVSVLLAQFAIYPTPAGRQTEEDTTDDPYGARSRMS
jgi:uncharacterized protein with PQ loop repeat